MRSIDSSDEVLLLEARSLDSVEQLDRAIQCTARNKEDHASKSIDNILSEAAVQAQFLPGEDHIVTVLEER